MEFINDLMKTTWFMKIVWSLVIITISIIIYKVVTRILIRWIESDRVSAHENNKKIKTYIKLIKSISRYAFIIVTLFLLLQLYGVNISSVVAGVGVLGVVFGLAIQDFLKDIIRGSSILSDNYFVVGDVVKYKEIEGKVLVIGLKTTKIQDIKNGNVLSVANRNIEEIQLVSNLIQENVPLPYELPLSKAEEIVGQIVERVKKCRDVKDCVYKGVNELDDSCCKYLIEVTCNPINKRQVRRDTLRSMLEVMEKNNVSVPYNQIDVHQK